VISRTQRAQRNAKSAKKTFAVFAAFAFLRRGKSRSGGEFPLDAPPASRQNPQKHSKNPQNKLGIALALGLGACLVTSFRNTRRHTHGS
jgi:hypothetical protein